MNTPGVRSLLSSREVSVFHITGSIDAQRALREGAFFSARAFEKDGPTSAFYVAELTGQAISLGHYQRAEIALHPRAHDRAVRRVTGGSAVAAGAGIVYVAVGLRDASVFLECPKARVLNRNVRGLLVGLTSAGAGTHYFGRDFVSVERRPAIYVAWTRTPEQHVLLEFFVSANASFVPGDGVSAYPAHSSPPLLDKVPITLAEAWGREATLNEVADRILHKGYAKTYGLTLEESAPTPSDEKAARYFTDVVTDDSALRWSPPHEVPIGFISAGLRRDANGDVHEAVLSGDFFQDAAAPALLNDTLRGSKGTREDLVRAINTAYGRDGLVIEGVPSLNTILDAFTDVI